MFAFKISHNLLPFKPEDFGLKICQCSRGPLLIQEIIRIERARDLARFRIPAKWNALPINIRNTLCTSKFKQLDVIWLLMYNYVS